MKALVLTVSDRVSEGTAIDTNAAGSLEIAEAETADTSNWVGNAFLTGVTASILLRAGSRKRRALTFEVGIQNSGLTIVILIGQLKGLGGAAAIAAIWGVWHLIAGMLVVSLFRTADRLRA